MRAMFHRLAGADNKIDSEELQDVLTATLTKGEPLHFRLLIKVLISMQPYWPITSVSPIDMNSSVFSLDACRAMIAMLDVSLSAAMFPCVSFPGHMICSVCTPVPHSQVTWYVVYVPLCLIPRSHDM